jgi:hypothetical protein
MITRQLPSGGASWTNYPSGRQTTQNTQRQRWQVPALRDLGVGHIARRRDLELMDHPRRARAADDRPAPNAAHREIGRRWGSSPTATQLAASPGGNGPDNMTDEPTRATCPRTPADASTARSFRNVLIKLPPGISILR